VLTASIRWSDERDNGIVLSCLTGLDESGIMGRWEIEWTKHGRRLRWYGETADPVLIHDLPSMGIRDFEVVCRYRCRQGECQHDTEYECADYSLHERPFLTARSS
jgi:hypothetical protein